MLQLFLSVDVLIHQLHLLKGRAHKQTHYLKLRNKQKVICGQVNYYFNCVLWICLKA